MTLDDVVTMLLAVAILDAYDAGHASAYCGMCACVESVRLIERAEFAGWVYR